MTDAFDDTLRCPIDPGREATLDRDQQSLVCGRCRVRFPVRNGLPVLVPGEADLPDGTRSVASLPCLRDRRGKR
jgi:uncharacterized protein YbaR (Trm112 family)